MKIRGLLLGLSLFTAVGTALYWILVFTGLLPVDEIVPGYTTWYWSFPLPDSWIVVTATLTAFAIIKKRDAMAITFGLLTAASMIFLALNEINFSLHTGMTLSEMGINLAIKAYCLIVGTFFIAQFSKQIKR